MHADIPGSANPFSNLVSAVDVFVIAHFLGWIAKALLFRDWVTLIVLSVGFEVIESTFQHILPNYNECWWDHLILDIFGCNAAGMCVGMALTGYLEGKGKNEGSPTHSCRRPALRGKGTPR